MSPLEYVCRNIFPRPSAAAAVADIFADRSSSVAVFKVDERGFYFFFVFEFITRVKNIFRFHVGDADAFSLCERFEAMLNKYGGGYPRPSPLL